MARRKLVETIIKLIRKFVNFYNKVKRMVFVPKMYKSCSDLPIRRFNKIYNTQDLRYLCLDYDGYNEIEAPTEAEQRWKDIFDEWIKLCDDSTISYYYQLVLEVTYLQTRYFVSKEMLEQIFTRYPNEMDEDVLDLYIEELKNWKYNYNKENDTLDEIQRLMQQHKASSNKLGIKKSELEEMQKEHGDSEVQTLEAQAVTLERITGIKTDLDRDSVLKWLETGRLATIINEQNRKNGK